MNTETSDVYFSEDISAVFTDSLNFQKKHSRLVRTYDDTFNGEFIPWGDDNQHPQNTIKEIEESDLLPSVIDFKKKALTSGGIQYGNVKFENGQEIYEPRQIPEIDDWLEQTEIENYLEEATLDFYTHANFFPEVILNVGRKITGLYCLDAAFCRMAIPEKIGKYKGHYRNIYVSADWDYSAYTLNAGMIQAVDPYYKVADQIKNGTGYKYALPLRNQVRGKLHYQTGPVDWLLNSGWLKVAKQIPHWKNEMMSRQLSIKYHIEVNKAYWTSRWEDWEKFSDQQRASKRQAVYTKFIKYFKGKQGANNTLFTEFTFDKQIKTEWPDFKVTVLETKAFQDNAYIEQSSHSDLHIIRSQSVDHTLIGLTPGKGFASGSGSDKRVAFNQHVLLTQPDQRKILRPLEYISDINGWHKKYGAPGDDGQMKIKWWFKNTFIATLDHGKDTKPANDNNNKKA
jgi:hypothetical protein